MADEPRVLARGEALDIVYEAVDTNTGRSTFHYFELRNLTIDNTYCELVLPNNIAAITDWHQRAKAFVEWVAQPSTNVGACKLIALATNAPDWKRQRWAATVDEYVKKAKADVVNKYLPLLKTKHGNSGAVYQVWVLVRVGLGRVLYERCQ